MANVETIFQGEHEQVVFFTDPVSGLKSIVAIHNTQLGPALGGCRMWNYESPQQALEDVLRLSKGMTYKAAVAGLNLGGGKAVILADPKKKNQKLFLEVLDLLLIAWAGVTLLLKTWELT